MYRTVWTIKCKRNGFVYKIFVETTEEKLNKYIETEIPDAISYRAATDEEVKAAKTIGLPIYMY